MARFVATFEPAVDDVDSVSFRVAQVTLHKTTEPAQVGRYTGNSFHCALSCKVLGEIIAACQLCDILWSIKWFKRGFRQLAKVSIRPTLQNTLWGIFYLTIRQFLNIVYKYMPLFVRNGVIACQIIGLDSLYFALLDISSSI